MPTAPPKAQEDLLGVSLTDHVADLQDGFPVCLQQELACGLICNEQTQQAAVSPAAARGSAPPPTSPWEPSGRGAAPRLGDKPPISPGTHQPSRFAHPRALGNLGPAAAGLRHRNPTRPGPRRALGPPALGAERRGPGPGRGTRPAPVPDPPAEGAAPVPRSRSKVPPPRPMVSARRRPGPIAPARSVPRPAPPRRGPSASALRRGGAASAGRLRDGRGPLPAHLPAAGGGGRRKKPPGAAAAPYPWARWARGAAGRRGVGQGPGGPCPRSRSVLNARHS